jgi:hypothetical protein
VSTDKPPPDPVPRAQPDTTGLGAPPPDGARRLTKAVTFSALDSLAERVLGEGSQMRITGEKTLRQNLKQEFMRFGPDSFSPTE